MSEVKSALDLKLLESAKRTMMGIKRPTYKVETMCLNCCSNIKLEIPRGIRVKGQECPNCGCKLGEES